MTKKPLMTLLELGFVKAGDLPVFQYGPYTAIITKVSADPTIHHMKISGDLYSTQPDIKYFSYFIDPLSHTPYPIDKDHGKNLNAVEALFLDNILHWITTYIADCED